jgi:hypothetical protein
MAELIEILNETSSTRIIFYSVAGLILLNIFLEFILDILRIIIRAVIEKYRTQKE